MYYKFFEKNIVKSGNNFSLGHMTYNNNLDVLFQLSPCNFGDKTASNGESYPMWLDLSMLGKWTKLTNKFKVHKRDLSYSCSTPHLRFVTYQ